MMWIGTFSCQRLVCWVKSSSTRKISCRTTASGTLGRSLRTSAKTRSNGPAMVHLCDGSQRGRELAEEGAGARILRWLVVAQLTHADGVVDQRRDKLLLDDQRRTEIGIVEHRYLELVLEEDVGPDAIHLNQTLIDVGDDAVARITILAT